ncbi:hypothetical protein Tco_1541245 [Tanacetum coccineum]
MTLKTRTSFIFKASSTTYQSRASYQTKLNLEQPNWNASDFPFKEDYTIVFKPRAVIYRDKDDNRKMMRKDEVHKFSDGTLTRIKEKLDFMVKDFKLFKFNKGIYERPHKGVKASANSDIVYFFTSAQDGDPLQDDGTVDFGLQLYIFATTSLIGYTDDDWAGCLSTRRQDYRPTPNLLKNYAYRAWRRVAGFKRRRRDLSSDDVRKLTTASGQNVNPPPTNNCLVLSAALRAKAGQELHELQTDMNKLKSDDESVDTPLVSPFPHSDDDSDDGEVLNELSKYENAGVLHQERIINSFDGDELAFQRKIGFRKFTAYFDPFLPMNIISHKAYNTIMVEGIEGTGKNLVSIVRDVYVFVKSFTYITDFVVLEDIGEFIINDMAEVLMGKPFRKITKLKYDVAKGLVSFTKIFDIYIFRMPRTIPRLRNFIWSKIPPLLELSQRDLMNELRHPYEKNKLMYKNFLNLGPEYQVDESMKEWLIHGHTSIHEVTLYLMRRSLEVLRKFHYTILGGRFNQLSHVSSPLSSKPGEY